MMGGVNIQIDAGDLLVRSKAWNEREAGLPLRPFS